MEEAVAQPRMEDWQKVRTLIRFAFGQSQGGDNCVVWQNNSSRSSILYSLPGNINFILYHYSWIENARTTDIESN